MNPPRKPNSKDSDLPVYAVRLAPVVTTIAVTEYDRLKSADGLVTADKWRDGLLSAWAGLATLPLRCAVAAENDGFQAFRPGPPLRVYLYQLRRGGNSWRILFTVHEETDDDPPSIQVHQLRHSSQDLFVDWLPDTS